MKYHPALNRKATETMRERYHKHTREVEEARHNRQSCYLGRYSHTTWEGKTVRTGLTPVSVQVRRRGGGGLKGARGHFEMMKISIYFYCGWWLHNSTLSKFNISRVWLVCVSHNSPIHSHFKCVGLCLKDLLSASSRTMLHSVFPGSTSIGDKARYCFRSSTCCDQH